jgi:predicted oxidoreductase
VADLNPSGGQHLLDHAQVQRKSEVQPHGMADDFSRETMAGVTRMARWFRPSRIARFGSLFG